jgi:hypothetical protein
LGGTNENLSQLKWTKRSTKGTNDFRAQHKIWTAYLNSREESARPEKKLRNFFSSVWCFFILIFQDFSFKYFDFQDIQFLGFKFSIFMIFFSAFASQDFNITPKFQGVRRSFFLSVRMQFFA